MSRFKSATTSLSVRGIGGVSPRAAKRDPCPEHPLLEAPPSSRTDRAPVLQRESRRRAGPTANVRAASFRAVDGACDEPNGCPRALATADRAGATHEHEWRDGDATREPVPRGK